MECCLLGFLRVFVLVRAPPGVYAPVSNTNDNPPCNTLFVGNLADGVDEAELQGLFSTQPVRHDSAPLSCAWVMVACHSVMLYLVIASIFSWHIYKSWNSIPWFDSPLAVSHITTAMAMLVECTRKILRHVVHPAEPGELWSAASMQPGLAACSATQLWPAGLPSPPTQHTVL